MNTTHWKRAKQVFHEALDKSAPERSGFVASACGEDRELRAQVQALLAAHDEAGEFMASPTVPEADRAARAATTVAASAPAERPGATIGPYKLLQVIGEGGFGVVYMAEQEEPVRRRVALKIIKLGMDTNQVIARFEAERQALALMEHPNIARVLDAGATETGRPYFVMELVKGVPITEYCDANRVTTRERLHLFTEICAALQHAHQKGIIHRDIKPSNILVTLHDGKPVPKVIDFGIAKATHQRLTEKTLFTAYGQFIGTPVYMSPEQAEMSSLDIDTRADIYSLGVLLYELLTGTTPFDIESLRQAGYGEMQRIIREEEPPKPSTRLSTLGGALTDVAKHRKIAPGGLTRLVRGDLDWIVMKALDKSRTRRYDSASEFAADIARHLGNEPVVARPPNAAYRFKKFIKKHKGPVTAVTAVVVTALVLGSAAVWQASVAQKRAEHVQTNSIVASAAATSDPLLKALLVLELADRQGVTGRLSIASEAANAPLPIAVLRGHGGPVTDFGFSPDGSRVVTAAWDGTARIWRADGTGEPIVLGGHGKQVFRAAFSPDGNRVATISTEFGESGPRNLVRVWPADGQGDPVILEGHENWLGDVCFSPDGTRVASASDDRTARVWRSDGTGEPIVLRGHERKVWHVAFSPDGTRVVTASPDGTARIWQADGTGETIVLQGHAEGVFEAAFSPDGTHVVTASLDGSARIWRADGTGVPTILDGHEGSLWSASFSPDGTRVLTASEGGTARIWQVGGAADPIVLRTNAGVMRGASFSPDGRRVATVSDDGTVRVWFADGTKTPLVIPSGFTGQVWGTEFSPDGSTLITGSSDGSVRLWRVDDSGETVILEEGQNVYGALFSPDGASVVTYPADDTVHVWSLDGRRRTLVDERASGLRIVTVSPDAKRVLTVSAEGTVMIRRVDRTERPVELRGHDQPVDRAFFSPDGSLILTATADGMLRIWRTDGSRPAVDLPGHQPLGRAVFSPDGTRVLLSSRTSQHREFRLVQTDGGGKAVVLPHEGRAYGISFSPDNSRVAITTGGTAHIWRGDGTGEPIVLRHGAVVVAVSFSPDGSRVATAGLDGLAKIWAADGTKEPIVLKGHTDMVFDVQFSPDGRHIGTSSEDGTARIWRSDGIEEPLILRGHRWGLSSVAFSPDGTRVVTASNDGTARIWRVTWPGLLEYLRRHTTACLTPEQRMQFLAESRLRALTHYAACERRHGREPALEEGIPVAKR